MRSRIISTRVTHLRTVHTRHRTTTGTTRTTIIAPRGRRYDFRSFKGVSVEATAILRTRHIPGASGLLGLAVSAKVSGEIVISNVTRRCSPRRVIKERVYVLTGLTPHGVHDVRSGNVVLVTERGSKGVEFVAPTRKIYGKTRVKW